MPARKITPARHQTATSKILQLKVTLRDVRPPIWRRILVATDISLHSLNEILLVVMGWHGGHLHEFEFNGRLYGESDPEWGVVRQDERKAKVGSLLRKPGDKLLYSYDFGDGWEHVVLLEDVVPIEIGRHYPSLLTGRRAGPQEDSGGPSGHQRIVEILRDPDHPEHAEIKDWLAPDYDPELFDAAGVNLQLAELFRQ